MGKLTISMAIFNRYVTNYQRVYVYIFDSKNPWISGYDFPLNQSIEYDPWPTLSPRPAQESQEESSSAESSSSAEEEGVMSQGVARHGPRWAPVGPGG